MRIQIIGYSGSGKSTLARRLGELYGLPVLHLDAVQFYGNWNERSLEEQNALVQKFLEQNEGWVIDGNYARVCPQRFAMADACIFLDFARVPCLAACLHRWRKYRGKARPSLGCEEKLDAEFFWWIMHKGRTKAQRAKHEEHLAAAKKGIRLRTRRQVDEYLASLSSDGATRQP